MRDPALSTADYGSALHRAAMGTVLGERSLKTWQNYVSAARAVYYRAIVEYPDQFPSKETLAEWLTRQMTVGGYGSSPDDVANWALGRDSVRERHEMKARVQDADVSEVPKSSPFLNSVHGNARDSAREAQSPEQVKAEARSYLRKQYTNASGKMICQVCKTELPFMLPNGSFYFETVEVFTTLRESFRETFIALCPNHAAMYRYANEQKDVLDELIETASGLEIDVVLAGKATTVQFTEVHLADMQVRLKAEYADQAPAHPPQTVFRTASGKTITVVRKPSNEM